MSGRPAVLADQVSFAYPGGVVALDEVSLRLEAGEIVGLVGQNGSGKTTLTKLLNGLLRPSSGRVLVDGVDTATRPVQELARQVGYVFQNPNHQLFARTVQQELEFGPRNLGLPADEIASRVEDAARFFGLSELLDVHPYRLSFPLRKLVGIASVHAMRPPTMVLDEPTTGQDHHTVGVIGALIRRLGELGTTVVCVSHDMPLLAEAVRRMVVMRDARILADAGPREIFADGDVLRQANLLPPQATRIGLRTLAKVPLTPDELAADIASATRTERRSHVHVGGTADLDGPR